MRSAKHISSYNSDNISDMIEKEKERKKEIPLELISLALASGATIAGLRNRKKINPPIATELVPGYFLSTSDFK